MKLYVDSINLIVNLQKKKKKKIMCKRMIPNKSLFKNTNKETVTIKDKTEWTINHL